MSRSARWAIAGLTVLGLTAQVAFAQPACQASQMKCAQSYLRALLACHATADARGLLVEPVCLAKARQKYDGPGNCCTATVVTASGCGTGGAVPATFIEARVQETVAALCPGYPAPMLSKCAAAKVKCTGKYVAAVSTCHERAIRRGIDVDLACLQRASDRFTLPVRGCMERAESRPPCLTSGDAPAIKADALETVNGLIDATSSTRPGEDPVGEDPVDVGVFADHQPAYRRGVAGSRVPVAFANPFDERELASDPITRSRLRISEGLGVPLDTFPTRVVAWGKYVLIGQYDDEYTGVFQVLTDQRMGVFDTETNAFCEIVVDPAANTSVHRLGVADPRARKTRIYFVGFHATGVEGAQFGYVDADLDRNPCGGGWPVVKLTGQDLNCLRGGGLPGCTYDGIADPAERPCPNGHCGADGLAVLDPETVVIGNTLPDGLLLNQGVEQAGNGRHIVVHVDAAGRVTVPDVGVVSTWRPPNDGSICYSSRPVADPLVDQTSSPADRRFIQAMDAYCAVPDDTPGCAPWLSFCPQDPTPGTCPASGHCSARYCQAFPVPCSTDAACGPLGPCVDTCTRGHPGVTCTNTGAPCATDANCPAPGRCLCQPPGRPMQEYSFDGSTLSAVSPLFQIAPGDGGYPMGPYDFQRNLWVADSGSERPIHLYKPTAGGEHAYHDPANATASVIVPPDEDMDYSGFNLFTRANGVAVGHAIYLAGEVSLQRALWSGSWAKDPTYKVALGTATLPAESRRCSDTKDPCATDDDCGSTAICHEFGCFAGGFGAPPTGPCTATLSCPSGQVCMDLAGHNATQVQYGGSPPSLWSMVGFIHPVPFGVFGDPREYPKNAYLVRVPVPTPVPDAVVTGRPSIAWSGGACAADPKQCRLWMAALENGVLRVRVRDDGMWSSWVPLPTNVTTAGAPAISADPTHVAVFARGADGQVYVSRLVSPVACDLETGCAFRDWEPLRPLPTGITATADVAATSTASGNTYVAVRGSDETVYYTFLFGLEWAPWVKTDGLVTDMAPTETYHGGDGKVWIAAKEKTTGIIKYTRVSSTSADPWVQVGAAAYPPAKGWWNKPPAIVSDGMWVHVFIPQEAFPQTIWQTVFDGTGWGAWRPLVSGTGATVQAAVANVNGTTNLVSYWSDSSAANMSEQALD
jgi:hypothetical protein